MKDSEKSTQLIHECPLCGFTYKSVHVRLVRETDDGSLLYFQCAQCKAGLVATLMEAPFGLLGSGLVTDLQFEEVERFAEGALPVSDDDVLEVHTLFSKRNDQLGKGSLKK